MSHLMNAEGEGGEGGGEGTGIHDFGTSIGA